MDMKTSIAMKLLRIFRLLVAIGFIAGFAQAQSSPLSVLKARVTAAISTLCQLPVEAAGQQVAGR